MPQVNEVLADLSDAVLAFCEDVVESASRASGVILGTPASAEIAQEPRLRFEWNVEPVRTAHSVMRLGHLFVVDQLRTLARLVVMDPPSVHGPFIITRALLDGAGVAYWLAEPEIGADRRVQRRLVSDLNGVDEQRIPDRPEFAESRVRANQIPVRIEAFCDHHGWEFQRSGPSRIGTESRPPRPSLIQDVLADGSSGAASGVGATAWWYLSGHTHSSSDALVSVVEPSGSSDPSVPNANIVVDGKQMVWLVYLSGLASRRLTARRHALFGDMDPPVEERGNDLDAELLRYMKAVTAGTLPGA